MKKQPEKLVLKPGLCNSEVDNGDFDADFRQVMRVGQLRRHVELKRLVILHVTVSQTNQQTTTLRK